MKKKNPYYQPQPGATDPTQCNGCGVCMLSCPIWHQHHTKALTYCGRNRALIGGADEEDLAPAARGCILCVPASRSAPWAPHAAGHDQAAQTLGARVLPRPVIPPTRNRETSAYCNPGKVLGNANCISVLAGTKARPFR
jgi:ferredoxin